MAKEQQRFELPDGNEVVGLQNLAEALGVKEVTMEDIQEGGQYADVVTLLDASDSEEDTGDTEDTGEGWEDGYPQGIEVDENAQQELSTMEFESLDELKDFIKDIDDDTLAYWAVQKGAEWTPNEHTNINRMRIAMALHAAYFPELVKPKSESKKKKAKYGDFDTKTLRAMAKDAKIKFKGTGNDAIDRMNIIMALKKSGHLAE